MNNIENIVNSEKFRLLSKEMKAVVAVFHLGEADRFELGKIVRDGYFPNVVHTLRYELDFDIPWRRHDYVNELGENKWRAIYYLSPEDKEKTQDLATGLI